MAENYNLFITSSASMKVGLERLSKEFPEERFAALSTEEFAADLGKFMRRFRRYRRTVFYTYDFETSRTILWHGIVWWLARQGVLLDGTGRKRTASLLMLLLRDVPQLVAEPLFLSYVFSRAAEDLSIIESKRPATLPQPWSIVYLRTDHWFGTKAGGSVTHIAGVAKAFWDFGIPLTFLSSDRLEMIDESCTPLVWVKPSKHIQNIPDAPQIAYNLRLISEANKVFADKPPTLIYQRYSQYNYSGAYLAAKWQVPFVLEYNGSELWMARHWGRPFRFQRWAEHIEMANLIAADAVIVVSDPMKAELVKRGIEPQKILANPNGVDIDRFDPELVKERSQILRTKVGIADKTVVGFIGTFGRWHGAEVLAKAIRGVTAENSSIHFLFIGDGVTLPSVRQIVHKTGVSESVTFTGMVPQEEGPIWLGACDILAAPHVPNPDGTPFFGSPTKLFEYMAMARGIVASRLDQIAEVLRHDDTAVLVKPGAVDELERAILRLAAKPAESARLGRNARIQAAESYTWAAHVDRTISHLNSVFPR